MFFIGFCLNSRSGSFETVRIMGVLQRFGISYFIVASIHVLVYVQPEDVLPKVSAEFFHNYDSATYELLFFRENSNELCTIFTY